MFKRLAVGLGALVMALTGSVAFAAPGVGVSQKVAVCSYAYNNRCVEPTAGGAMPISGTITTSLGAFIPKGNATLAVTTTSARVAFPTGDTSVIIRNTGTADAYLAFGTTSVVATTSSTLLPAGQAVNFDTGGAVDVAAITASGSTSLSITTGTGLSALTGGGGGSGGGGGAITAASGSYAAGAFAVGSGVDGWNLTEGAKGDTAYAGSGSASMVAILKGLYAAVSGPIPTQAGTVIIGGVGFDQANNGVTAKAAATGGRTTGTTAALSTTVTSIKSSAGSLYKVLCYNPNATVAFVQIFNIASGSVTLGTSTSVDTVPVPATSNAGFDGGSLGDAFGTAISYAATTTPGGSTAPGTALTCSYAYN